MANDTSGEQTKTTVNEFVYNALKDDILWGSFKPEDRLRFDELRTRYKVSFSSLREALARLASDGLVEMESHRGARVAGINLDDFKDLTAVRQIVESNCLRLAIELGDDHWEGQAIAAYHMYETFVRSNLDSEEDSLRTRVQRHEGFHTALISACNSRRLLNLRSVLNAQAERYLTLAYRTVPADPHALLRDHGVLLRAAIDRKTSLACAIIEEHIGNAAERLASQLEGAELAVDDAKPAKSRRRRKALPA
ncbi:MAG: GntR family transcriptional regulator [Novosphingobium sp.]